MAERTIMRRLTRALAVIPRRVQWNKGFRGSLATESWTARQLKDHLDRSLTRIVRYAAREIPFYRRLYGAAGVDLSAFSGTEDMHRLPTIDKAALLEAGAELVKPGRRRLLTHTLTTGGSTGTIATIHCQRGFGNIESGCIFALWSRVGVRKGDRMVRLRGALLEGGNALSARGKDGQLMISTYHLRDENVDEILRLIAGYRPDWLHVYPSAATLLATVLKRTGKTFPCPVKGVLCGSEGIFPWQIDLFKEVYGGRVYSHYGHGELAVLGGWCEEATTFHFLPNYGYLELLDEDRQPISDPGVTGEMTGTGFLNPVMPMIRYRMADYGAWDQPGPCPACGRAHQRLVKIDGRIQEYLILKDGTRFPATNINALHGAFFSHVFKFQFLQREPGKATFRFVPAHALTEQAMRDIRSAFAFFEPMGLELEYEPVEEIPPTPRGKCRIVTQQRQLSTGEGP